MEYKTSAISLADLEILITECYKKRNEYCKLHGENSKQAKKYKNKLDKLNDEFDNRIDRLLNL